MPFFISLLSFSLYSIISNFTTGIAPVTKRCEFWKDICLTEHNNSAKMKFQMLQTTIRGLRRCPNEHNLNFIFGLKAGFTVSEQLTCGSAGVWGRGKLRGEHRHPTKTLVKHSTARVKVTRANTQKYTSSFPCKGKEKRQWPINQTS